MDPRAGTAPKRMAIAFLWFLPIAAIGTVSHELGHVAAHRVVGYSAVLHYATTEWSEPPQTALDLGIASAGGPLQTIVTGTLGLLALWWFRKRRVMDWKTWIATLAALFWSRELFNLLKGLLDFALSGYGPTIGDEYQLAAMLGWWRWSIQLPLGVIGLGVCCLVVKWTPTDWRIPLIVGGIAGSLVGFAIWMKLLGPILLP